MNYLFKLCHLLIKKQINTANTYRLPVSLNIKQKSEAKKEAVLMFLSEPKIFQIYKTYKILQRARNILNKSAVMYKRSHFP